MGLSSLGSQTCETRSPDARRPRSVISHTRTRGHRIRGHADTLSARVVSRYALQLFCGDIFVLATVAPCKGDTALSPTSLWCAPRKLPRGGGPKFGLRQNANFPTRRECGSGVSEDSIDPEWLRRRCS